MDKRIKVLMLLVILSCFLNYPLSGFAYYPPDPTIPGFYHGDADGDEYMTVLDIPAHETQANAGLSLDYNTMQPNNDDQRWNTCDADGDGYCTVLDLPYLYRVSSGGIIDQSPFSAWKIDNYNLPTSGNSSGAWIPFQLSVKADASAGWIGRPGMIVKVTIVPTGSTTTGKLTGRSCTPDYWGNPDQPNTGDNQCAVGVSITDWMNLPAEGLTEDAGDSYGLKVWANSGGTLHLKTEVAAIDSFLIPAFSNDFYISFNSAYSINIDCSLPGPNPVDELIPMQCNITSDGTPETDYSNDTCGGYISGIGPWTYDFTPSEAQGPGNCIAAVEVIESTYYKDSGVVNVNEVNLNPVWNPAPSNIQIVFNGAYSQFNGHADDPDLPAQTLICTKTGQTCSFPVTVSGSGSGAADCTLSFIAGPSLETCAVNVEVTDSISTIPASVNIYVVPEVRWYVDGDVTSSGDCMTWATACKTVQEGVNKAVSGDWVWVAEATYTAAGSASVLTMTMKDGVEIYGGFAGTETQLSQRNITLHPTILDGQNVSYHVVIGESNARIDGFTIKRGNANGTSPNNLGGGMFNTSKTSLVIANCTFSGNRTSGTGPGGGGAGIYNDNSNPTITNCTFSGNSTSGTGVAGGGIFNVYSDITITNCTFSGNWSYNGGGMLNNISSPTITNCTFSGNSSVNGGGIYNVYSNITITNSTFLGNTTTGVSNGGGGGICNTSSSPTITNCTFSGNSAYQGGGIYNQSTSVPNIKNCILWNDLAGSDTPEIYNNSSTPIVSYSDIKMSPSSVYTGTGNINSGPLFLHVPLFWDITTGTGTTNTIIVAASSGYNVNDVIEILNDGVVRTVTSASGTTVYFTPALSSASQRYWPVGNWGPGETDMTENLRIPTGSPCKDTATSVGAPAYDLDGYPRPYPVGGAFDMGAYEYHP